VIQTIIFIPDKNIDPFGSPGNTYWDAFQILKSHPAPPGPHSTIPVYPIGEIVTAQNKYIQSINAPGTNGRGRC
jgi:hypothetical protein